MVGTPAQSGPDSEQGGTSLRRGNKDGPEGPGSGGSVDRNSNRDTPPLEVLTTLPYTFSMPCLESSVLLAGPTSAAQRCDDLVEV